MALTGVAIGVAGALARFLSSPLYVVEPADPLTFIAVSLILTASGAIADFGGSTVGAYLNTDSVTSCADHGGL